MGAVRAVETAPRNAQANEINATDNKIRVDRVKSVITSRPEEARAASVPLNCRECRERELLRIRPSGGALFGCALASQMNGSQHCMPDFLAHPFYGHVSGEPVVTVLLHEDRKKLIRKRITERHNPGQVDRDRFRQGLYPNSQLYSGMATGKEIADFGS